MLICQFDYHFTSYFTNLNNPFSGLYTSFGYFSTNFHTQPFTVLGWNVGYSFLICDISSDQCRPSGYLLSNSIALVYICPVIVFVFVYIIYKYMYI